MVNLELCARYPKIPLSSKRIRREHRTRTFSVGRRILLSVSMRAPVNALGIVGVTRAADYHVSQTSKTLSGRYATFLENLLLSSRAKSRILGLSNRSSFGGAIHSSGDSSRYGGRRLCVRRTRAHRWLRCADFESGVFLKCVASPPGESESIGSGFSTGASFHLFSSFYDDCAILRY